MDKIMRWIESASIARAAANLARQDRPDLARKMMLGEEA